MPDLDTLHEITLPSGKVGTIYQTKLDKILIWNLDGEQDGLAKTKRECVHKLYLADQWQEGDGYDVKPKVLEARLRAKGIEIVYPDWAK